MAKPRFTTDFPGAVFWEGSNELTLRAQVEGVLRTFMDTTNVGNKIWGFRQLTRTGTLSARPFSKESKDQIGLSSLYTHSLVARTFFCAQRAHSVLRTSSCVSHTHAWLKVKNKGLLHAHVVHPDFTFSALMFHAAPSAILARSLRDQPHRRTRPHLLAELSRPNCARQAHFRTRTSSLAT